jgi:hypothetical protein
MHSLQLLAEALGRDATYRPEPLPEPAERGLCCLIGIECDTIARRHLLTTSFTDWDVLQRPDSDRISVAAWIAFTAGELRDGKSRRYCPERMSSWRCTAAAFVPLTRQAVREAVLGDLPTAPWVGYATTSYKKHGSLRAPVNTGASNVWLWETRLVDCSDSATLQATWSALRRYQDIGIPRPVLEVAELDAAMVAKVGVKTALEFQAWARPRASSALYQFLVYLLPSRDELAEHNGSPPPVACAPRAPAIGETLDLFA